MERGPPCARPPRARRAPPAAPGLPAAPGHRGRATTRGVLAAAASVPAGALLTAGPPLLGVVPLVGAIVPGVVAAATLVTVGQPQGIIALVVLIAYQQIEGTVVQRRTIELDPAVVLGSVLLGTAAAGSFGGVLALPLAAAAKVLAADALEQRRARWRRARSRSAVAPTDEPRLVERPPPR